ncbi:MAG: T9SS type A sorting domain-containing protein, partial [Bacteroidales bacterium]|nr:T9SS type A sorting domain-containing protein [Bacteroidales bacterium]
GVYAHNARYATVVRDSIAVGRGGDCAFGVYADGVSGLCLEENTFFPSTGYLGVSYGIGLFNSESASDVYLNTLEGLTCGNLAVGMNTQKAQGLSGTGVQGLTYTCNRNTGNTIDFCVLGNDGGGGGIRPQQGSLALPAGNTFGASGYHFYNDGDNTVDYCYYSGDTDQVPDNAKLYRVNRIPTTMENGCQSHYGLGNVNRSPEDVIRAILNDSVTDHQELRARLRGMGDLASDRLAIASYVQEGDFDGAFTLAQTLPSLYRMDGDEQADHSNHLRLLGLYRTLHQSGRTTGQLTGDERLLVEDIARAGYPYSGSLARALLEETSHERGTRYRCPELPKITERGNGSANTEEREARDFKVTVTPNPASSQATVEYTLPEGSTRAALSVVNTLGEKMTELGLEGNRGSRIVGLHELPAGVYFIVVTDQSGKTSSGKVILNN